MPGPPSRGWWSQVLLSRCNSAAIVPRPEVGLPSSHEGCGATGHPSYPCALSGARVSPGWAHCQDIGAEFNRMFLPPAARIAKTGLRAEPVPTGHLPVLLRRWDGGSFGVFPAGDLPVGEPSTVSSTGAQRCPPSREGLRVFFRRLRGSVRSNRNEPGQRI